MMCLARNDPFATAAGPEMTMQTQIAAQPVGGARDRHTSTSGTRPVFDCDLLRQYAQNRPPGAPGLGLPIVKSLIEPHSGAPSPRSKLHAPPVRVMTALEPATEILLPLHGVPPDRAEVLAAGHANNWYIHPLSRAAMRRKATPECDPFRLELSGRPLARAPQDESLDCFTGGEITCAVR
jgi:hypothetical protein